MEWVVTGEVVEWRGPSPFVYLPMTPEDSADLKVEAAGLAYWGQVAVEVTTGDSTFTTALFPQGDRYMVPLRVAIRRAEGIEVGAPLTASVRIRYDR